jgi:hypothetical protein
LNDINRDWLPLVGDWDDELRGINLAFFDGDGDGDFDAAGTNTGNTVDYWERTGPDSFERRLANDNPLDGFNVAPKAEIAVLNADGNAWTIEAQNPDGSFDPTGVSFAVPGNARVSAQDANGDNRPDLVLSIGEVFFNTTENPGDPLSFSDAIDVLDGRPHDTTKHPLFLPLDRDDAITDLVTFPRTGPGNSNVATFYRGSLPQVDEEIFLTDTVEFDPVNRTLTIGLKRSLGGQDYFLKRIVL